MTIRFTEADFAWWTDLSLSAPAPAPDASSGAGAGAFHGTHYKLILASSANEIYEKTI